jgi:uncharacterized protein YicC (UPF0701 family)
MPRQNITRAHINRPARVVARRPAINNRPVNRNMVRASVRGVGNAQVLRNSAIASVGALHGARGAWAQNKFQGRWASNNWHNGNRWNWRHYHPIVAIGWFGSLFWPYAYWDLLDYTYWPYAYDAFWPYAYDDLYVGVYGPYAYEGPTYVGGSSAVRPVRASQPTPVVCGGPAPELANWPIQQISQTVQPDEAQQQLLNGLKEATAKAIGVLQAACPNNLPSTPTGRLAAMRQRVETMQKALEIIGPAQARFYESLNDEQKARFNALEQATTANAAATPAKPNDLSQICNMQAAKATDVPTEVIARTLKVTDAQRSALDALDTASAKAADFLKANCPEGQALTPPGRVTAMSQRLDAMHEAINNVQPAFDHFYGLLTDEQKARFNQLGPRKVSATQ